VLRRQCVGDQGLVAAGDGANRQPVGGDVIRLGGGVEAVCSLMRPLNNVGLLALLVLVLLCVNTRWLARVLTRWQGYHSTADLEHFDEFLKMLEDEEAEAVNRQWREVGTWAQRWSPTVPHPFAHTLGSLSVNLALLRIPPPAESPRQSCGRSIRVAICRGWWVQPAASESAQGFLAHSGRGCC
jgi:hypothetical protein